MLHIILELSGEFVAICHVLNAVSVSFAILEIAFEAALIWPRHLALSVHLVIMEIAFVGLSGVDEIVLALTLELSVDKVAFIHVTILNVLALAGFLSLDEVAGVFALSPFPNLLSFSKLLIIVPLAFVQGAIHFVVENAHTMSLAFGPHTLVDVSISVFHAAWSFHVFVFDLSRVKRTVLVFDIAQAFPDGLVVLVKLTFVLAFVVDLRPVVVPHKIISSISGHQICFPLLLAHERVFRFFHLWEGRLLQICVKQVKIRITVSLNQLISESANWRI